MTIQIEIGTREQYEKIVRFLNRLKIKFIKKEDVLPNGAFDMENYRQQIKQVSVWSDSDVAAIEQSTQDFNWTAPRMVIDTSVFIEHLRAKDKTRTTLATLPANQTPYVAAITSYEFYMGATTPAKWQDVEALINPLPLLIVYNVIAQRAALIYQQLSQSGILIDHRDILIAATALVHNLPVKTLNIRHFNRISGLTLL